MRGVCAQCARRNWLLAELNIRLEQNADDPTHLWSALELSDLELIEALGGRRRDELNEAHRDWRPIPHSRGQQREICRGICRHHAAYPRNLCEDALAPHSLQVRGPLGRLAELLDGKVVAIVGTGRASDYGMETARGLARGLSASGVTVAGNLSEGISSAVHLGALEADRSTLAVMTAGVESCAPAWCEPLYRQILEHGCAIAEAHRGPRVRRWWRYASARTLALLADMVIVVEATEQAAELACANVAWSRARHVAAVPGRVSSANASGTNSLLMRGARLVRDPQDALDVLYGTGIRDGSITGLPDSTELDPRLSRVFERVGNGEDTVAKLTARDSARGEVSVALAELELQGMLLRGDGGRYVPCATWR